MSLQEQAKIRRLPGIFRRQVGQIRGGRECVLPREALCRRTGRASRGNLGHRGLPGAWYRTECRSRNPSAGELSAEDRKAAGSLCGAGIAGPGGIMASRTGQKNTLRLSLRGCENKKTAVYRTARMAVSGGALSGALSRAFFPASFPGWFPYRLPEIGPDS